MTTRISATINRTGTTCLKTVSGRCSSSQAPTMAPANDAGICQRSRGPWPSSSRRYPQVPEALPGTRPIAFDMVAVTGGNPNATSVGNVTRVPEPTTALIVPAPTPARKMTTISTVVTGRRRSRRARRAAGARWSSSAGNSLRHPTADHGRRAVRGRGHQHPERLSAALRSRPQCPRVSATSPIPEWKWL